MQLGATHLGAPEESYTTNANNSSPGLQGTSFVQLPCGKCQTKLNMQGEFSFVAVGKFLSGTNSVVFRCFMCGSGVTISPADLKAPETTSTKTSPKPTSQLLTQDLSMVDCNSNQTSSASTENSDSQTELNTGKRNHTKAETPMDDNSNETLVSPVQSVATSTTAATKPLASSPPNTATKQRGIKKSPVGIKQFLSPLFIQKKDSAPGLPKKASYSPKFPLRLKVVRSDCVPPCVPRVGLHNGQTLIGVPDRTAVDFRIVNITRVQDGNREKYEGNLKLALYVKNGESFVVTGTRFLTSTKLKNTPQSQRPCEQRAFEMDPVMTLPSMLLAEQLWQRLTKGAPSLQVATLDKLYPCFPHEQGLQMWSSNDINSIFPGATITKEKFFQLCTFWLSEANPAVVSFDMVSVEYWRSHSWICGFFDDNDYERLFSVFPDHTLLHFCNKFSGRYVLKCSPTQEEFSIFYKERDSPYMVAAHEGTLIHVKLHSTPITSSSTGIPPVQMPGWYVPVPIGTLPSFFPSLQEVIESILPVCHGWITREILQGYVYKKQHHLL
ncbi:hypothetical protein Pelo_2511 [Pelomyxa schiedti]|nr:hypothetical protein Pelo_2511 [Pelomyxa schiedti]